VARLESQRLAEPGGNHRQCQPANNQQFNQLDFNRNGSISRDEWYWSRASFDQRDDNRDGVLSRREFNTFGGDATPAGDAREIRIDPRERWVATGVYVRSGDHVNINARGTIQMRENAPDDIATPAGSRSGRRADNAPFRDQPAGALIGRIGNGTPFLIGNLGAFTATGTGQLYLGVNDDHLLDNSGEFIVTLDVLSR
jgi:hypothetical protein